MCYPSYPSPSYECVWQQVEQALQEDIGVCDYTAALLGEHASQAKARIFTREPCVVCGRLWVELCTKQINPDVEVSWHVEEGQYVDANTVLLVMQGPVKSLLSIERTLLNFLQTLSGTATETRKFVDAVAHTPAKIYDTRKTIPGWRLAQKYAVRIGGGENQRMGLYDTILIKENHIMAKGGVGPALEAAQSFQLPVQIEVENLKQLEEALHCGADLILLDNMHEEEMIEAVRLSRGRAQLEASGGIHLANVGRIADTGVDRISVGAITKHLHAIDLSMRLF